MRVGILKQITQFLKEVKIELSRVEWPKRSEFIGSTIITLILVFLFTIYFGVVDKASGWVIYENIFKHIKR